MSERIGVFKRLLDKLLNDSELIKREQSLDRREKGLDHREEKFVLAWRAQNNKLRFFTAQAWRDAIEAEEQWNISHKMLKGELYATVDNKEESYCADCVHEVNP